MLPACLPNALLQDHVLPAHYFLTTNGRHMHWLQDWSLVSLHLLVKLSHASRSGRFSISLKKNQARKFVDDERKASFLWLYSDETIIFSSSAWLISIGDRDLPSSGINVDRTGDVWIIPSQVRAFVRFVLGSILPSFHKKVKTVPTPALLPPPFSNLMTPPARLLYYSGFALPRYQSDQTPMLIAT